MLSIADLSFNDTYISVSDQFLSGVNVSPGYCMALLYRQFMTTAFLDHNNVCVIRV
jgi:hypothetical protein